MKILVLSNAAWDVRNSVGNTLSNWFDGWTDAEISCIYSRDALPNCTCCKRFLSVSPLNIVRNIFRPWTIGRVFDNENTEKCVSSNNMEDNAVKNFKGWKRKFALLFVDLLYQSNIWFNSKVNRFIADSNPDVVFMFSIPDAFRYNLLKYIRTHTKAKVVQYIADDIYGATFIDNNLIDKIHRSRYRNLIHMADKVYGASEQMCSFYQDQFGINVSPLYKGCDIERPKAYVNTPIKIVYAGNLLYGRDKSLLSLAEAIHSVNQSSIRVELYIYSGSSLSEEIDNKIKTLSGTYFCGRISYDEVKKKLHEADLVLHVESFEPKQIQLVRYSFSTKIIDCLQSGSTLFVIGPKGIASVEYPRRIPGAIVVDNVDDVPNTLSSLLDKPQILLERAKDMYDFATEKHSLLNVRKRIQCDFCDLLNRQ